MMKDSEDCQELWLKIKHTSEILKTFSPAKIAHAILNGRNPPNVTHDALRMKASRLLKKRDDTGEISPKRSPGSGRPVSVTTPKKLGRVKNKYLIDEK